MTDKERIAELEEEVRALANRCLALTHGMFCDFCGVKDCIANKETEKPKKVRKRDRLEG